MAGENHPKQRPGEISEGRASQAKGNDHAVKGAWKNKRNNKEDNVAGVKREQ